MGSKRAMLRNGLGGIIGEAVSNSKRFIDLFAGSGAVAHFVAEQYRVPVFANDLQAFSAALSAPILERTQPTEVEWVSGWLEEVEGIVREQKLFAKASSLQERILAEPDDISSVASEARELCQWAGSDFARAYGGYYFSPLQSIIFAVMRENLPKNGDLRAIAMAASIQAASVCSASPGHTAQPFNPYMNAGRFVAEAWAKDVTAQVGNFSRRISGRHALVAGGVSILDANKLATTLGDGDLVFLDPPYSGVHYSRFYHVLETLARGRSGEVSGIGRYPAPIERPRSSYSMKTTSLEAFNHLLQTLSTKRCSAIVTFPADQASNGLSGDDVYRVSKKYFKVERELVTGRFSTLGGNTLNRSARVESKELILSLVAN